MLYTLSLVFGVFWLRSATELFGIVLKDSTNTPLVILKYPLLLKISSPAWVLFIQAINGYLVTEKIIYLILFPLFTFLLQLVLTTWIKKLSVKTQFSFFFNPVVHNILFSILLLSLTISNLIRFFYSE